jgi:hypothetical protein
VLEGYDYCLNNPLKYTDPSGYVALKTWSDFWQVVDNLWNSSSGESWDSNNGYSDGAQGGGSGVTSGSGFQGPGLPYMLGEVTVAAKAPQKNNSSDSPQSGGDKPDGIVYSFSFDFAFGGGAGFEIGLVTDKNGGRQWFASGNANIGYGISAGPNIRSIQSMPGSTFKATDYQGYSNGINIGIGSLGYSNAGDKNSGQWSYDGLFNYGKSYIEEGGGYSFFSNTPTYGVIWSNTSTKLKLRK